MLNKNAPSKRRTNILEQAMENAPATSKNLVVYQYNFRKRDYEMHNPFDLQMSNSYPTRKIRLVCRDIRTNVKEFPRPRFQRQYLCKATSFYSIKLTSYLVLTIFLETLFVILLSLFYGIKIFTIDTESKDKGALRT